MRGAERVVFALGALGEAGKPAALAQRADAVAAAGENLVRIGLVADVPDQPVGGRVEDVMQRHGEFDHAEAGAEMAAGDGDSVDRLLAQFVGDLPKLAGFKPPEIVWGFDVVEQWGLGRNRHATLLSFNECFFGLMADCWGPSKGPRMEYADFSVPIRVLTPIMGPVRNLIGRDWTSAYRELSSSPMPYLLVPLCPLSLPL